MRVLSNEDIDQLLTMPILATLKELARDPQISTGIRFR